MLSNKLVYYVCAFISASMIIMSTITVPVNALADAEPIAETVLTQPADVTDEPITIIEDPLTVVSPETIDTTPLLVEPPLEPTPEIQQQIDTTLTSDTNIATDTAQDTTSGDIAVVDSEDVDSASTGQAESTTFIANDATNITSLDGGTISLLTSPTDTSTDIIINPQTASDSQASTPVLIDGTVLIDNSTTIANVVVVDSSSGSATIINNDDVGDVTTGDAITDVSILNMANNIVASGDVFVGAITVHGDFSNDIILSQALIDYLINGTMSNPSLFSSNVDVSSLQVITNTINTAAKSGEVAITNNDDVGDVTTGDAHTFVLIKNFNGNFVLYGNSLLFIVNVTGTWNGTILGNQNNGVAVLSAADDGITVSTPLTSSPVASSSITVKNSTTITNDVTATATSGDITLKDNDDIGNITTGNASVRVSILNVLNTIVSFSNWLGVIFINIFGNWNGGVVMQQSMQENTPAPAPVEEFIYPGPLTSAASMPQSSIRQFFRSLGSSTPVSDTTPTDTTIVAAVSNDPLPAIVKISDENSSSYLWAAIVAIIGGGMFVGSKMYTLRE